MRVSEGLSVESTAEIITRETPALDRPLLDAVAATSFRTAAVRLAREPPQSEFANEAADQAAQALLSLATSRDESALRQILRPDPGMGDTTWTVACYQIGDLTPCALLDFANPVSAVTTLARCEEASHVAAELVASNPTGTRWTALTRTGKAVRFQLPDDRSASGATRENFGEMSLADRHWRDQLKRWATDGGSSEWASATPSARPVKVPQEQEWVELGPDATVRVGSGQRHLEIGVAEVVAHHGVAGVMMPRAQRRHDGEGDGRLGQDLHTQRYDPGLVRLDRRQHLDLGGMGTGEQVGREADSQLSRPWCRGTAAGWPVRWSSSRPRAQPREP